MDLNPLAKAFAHVVGVVRKHPWASVYATGFITWGSVLFILGSVLINNYEPTMQFVERWFPNPQVEQRNFTEGTKRDDAVCHVVRYGMNKIGADRAIFTGFHNGTSQLNGVAWSYSQIVCPEARKGLVPQVTFDKVPNSVYAEVHTKIFPEPGKAACIRVTPEGVQSSYIQYVLDSLGADIAFTCGVLDEQGVQIGRMSFLWGNRKAAPTDDEVFAVVQQVAKDVGALNSVREVPKVTEDPYRASEGTSE